MRRVLLWQLCRATVPTVIQGPRSTARYRCPGGPAAGARSALAVHCHVGVIRTQSGTDREEPGAGGRHATRAAFIVHRFCAVRESARLVVTSSPVTRSPGMAWSGRCEMATVLYIPVDADPANTTNGRCFSATSVPSLATNEHGLNDWHKDRRARETASAVNETRKTGTGDQRDDHTDKRLSAADERGGRRYFREQPGLASVNGSAGLTDLPASTGVVSTSHVKRSVLQTADLGNTADDARFRLATVPCPVAESNTVCGDLSGPITPALTAGEVINVDADHCDDPLGESTNGLLEFSVDAFGGSLRSGSYALKISMTLTNLRVRTSSARSMT